MQAIQKKIVWASVVLCGCLDINLIDEMLPADAGSAPPGESAHCTGTDPGEETETGPALPVPDPDDTAPPELTTPDCGETEQVESHLCMAVGPITVSLRFVTDEPAVVSLSVDGNGRAGVLSPLWSTEHHVVITELEPDIVTPVQVRLEDINSNPNDIEISVRAPDGPTVAITEILADPLGPEPAQEFVEIANYGREEVDLSGWMIDDNGDANSLGNLIAEGTVLAPGTVAIAVSGSYDAQAGADPAPDPDGVVIVLDSTVCSNGLRNSDAESVELYDATGALVSQYRGQAGTPREGVSAMRLTAELPDSDKRAFDLEPGGSSTPGRTPFLE